MKSGNILVVDDEKVIRDGCQDILRKDYYVECIETGREAINALAKDLFHLVLLDLKLPDIDGMQVLEKIKKENPHVEVIVITAYATIESAVEAVKKGADDYISKPFTPQELRLSVQKALRKKSLELENIYLKEKTEKRDEPVITVGNSPKMKRIYELIRKVAPTDSTVLICGESGTGKELIAREIHRQSLRRDRPFLAVDCGALVETLLESELFGHIKGSFTDAYSTKHGSFELANGGTFFFDEVANLSLGIQAKLLRATQEREIRPVGGEKPIRIDVR
ncbi:MAG: Fis family transcriptional regulator, partial [Armatimonadetes bacterium CG07_land_8_20_14_0_80_40_9]